ncbi:D-xylulose 5-phosphate/D-fructose 6-phosphate phosphoketolase [Corynebacterium efficiens YS-314]|nr:D-xylulose 5-phosphate/D-fructose 6-phosphate phosphoketolase [Corynebacterium efficiens YS-314]
MHRSPPRAPSTRAARGYALSHAFGAAFDNPDLIVAAVVGDGEAETGALEGSWKSVSFLNPEHDGAVLPILHLNGGKIASPTVLSRKDPDEVQALLEGHGYEVIWVEGEDLPWMHERFANALTYAYDRIKAIQTEACSENWDGERPVWPMIILRTPKGWTGPHTVDHKIYEGTWRSHQVPLDGMKEDEKQLRLLEEWLRSYRPEELFNPDGTLTDLVRANNPAGELRMSANPHANGGLLTRDLKLRDLSNYEREVTDETRGRIKAESTRTLGEIMRDAYEDNPDNFRLFCPDETNSNRLGAVFEVSDRTFMERTDLIDEKLSRKGRVMEVLSEHNCHGWLDGYNLTGRHGLYASYEAFGMVSASMTMQAGKWFQEANHLDWRAKTPSLNILLSSTCWRNDHNGFSHQAPELLNVVLNMNKAVGRIYLPVDANSLAVVSEKIFADRNKVNLVIQDKQPQLQYMSLDEAKDHVGPGSGVQARLRCPRPAPAAAGALRPLWPLPGEPPGGGFVRRQACRRSPVAEIYPLGYGVCRGVSMRTSASVCIPVERRGPPCPPLPIPPADRIQPPSP